MYCTSFIVKGLDECELVLKKLSVVEALSHMSHDVALSMRSMMRLNLRNVVRDQREVVLLICFDFSVDTAVWWSTKLGK